MYPIFIGFKRYSTLEFEKDGFRILFDVDYAIKFNNYIESWGVDQEAVFENLVEDCCALIKGTYIKRNDLPMRFSASSRYGTTINLLNGIKVQFGKEYKSEMHEICVEEEKMVHFFY